MRDQFQTTLTCRRCDQENGFEIVRRKERSEEHTSELQSLTNLVCRLLLEKKNMMIVMVSVADISQKLGLLCFLLGLGVLANCRIIRHQFTVRVCVVDHLISIRTQHVSTT